MNMDIEKTGKDLQNKDNRKHAAGTVAGGIIGGVVGGYPGMQIGMAIGGYLFKPSSPNKKDYNNPDYKISNTRVDSVPDIIGTDICPGKVIYFNKDTFGVYDSGHLPFGAGGVGVTGPTECSEEWIMFIDALADEKAAYWTEFAVNFVGNYKTYNYVGVPKFNGKPFWFWLIFSDQWENYIDALNPCPSLTVLDAAKIEYYQNIDVEELTGQNINPNNIMYFKGFFADFTAAAVAPETSNLMIDLRFVEEINPAQLPGPLSAMPIFTAEVNSDQVWLSPESMHGGAGMAGATNYYNKPGGVYDPDTYYNYSIGYDGYWGCRDARNNYYVGVRGGFNYQTEQYEWFPVFLEGGERKWDYAIAPYDRYAYYHDPDGTVKDYFRDNIISPSYSPAAFVGSSTHYKNSSIRFLQCTDVIDDRVYFCTHRNWLNAGETEHHHAGYGTTFDIYYHDRSSPYQEVHSLIYDYELNNPEENYSGESCNPSLHFQSMQVDEDYIYIFGSRVQTDIVLTDYRTIEDEENSRTKVYCDLSQYPDGFWEGRYAALSQNTYKIWREITEQTSTYITVAKEWAVDPTPSSKVQLSKYPQWVADWGVIGAINGDSQIICNPPTWNSDGWLDSEYSGLTRWNYCFLVGKWLYGTVISSISGSVINLAAPLEYYYPEVGDVLCFTMQHSADFDEYYTDPRMDEYIGTFYNELGFNSYPEKDDLANLNASRISGNEFNRSHHVAWRINKTTGSVETFDSQRLTTPTYYVGSNLTYSGGVTVHSCATDKTAFVYSHESQYGTQNAVYSYVLDFDDSEIKEVVHRRNNYAGGHAPAWCYMGCVPVKEWDEDVQEWVNVWYTILRCFDSQDSNYPGYVRDTIGWGTHFLRLNDGRFSNKQVYFDNINLYYGLDIGDNIDQILFRKHIATGPLYMAMWTNSFESENEYQIGKFGITEDIYFTVVKIQGMLGTGISSMFESWRYTPPSEVDPAGELYCIGKSALTDADNNNLDFQWTHIPPYGGFKQCRYGFYDFGESGRWYQCDESPASVIEDFFTKYKDPSYVTSGLYSVSPCNFDEAIEICNEIIDTTLYTVKENIDLKERRFQFSQCYDQPKKFYDVIQDVLQTCQGFISTCIWEDGKYKMIIPNPDERPVYYFGLDSAVFVSTQLSDELDLIYGNFSAYPDNYWKGDLVHFDEVMDFSNPSSDEPQLPPSDRDWAVIIEQTSTYIKMGTRFGSYYFPASKSFTLKKDNMKEGSFTFAEKSYLDRPNKVRIEFKNRLLGYIKDIAEAEDPYRLDILGEPEKIDHYKMHGIKRATQAGRMAQRILDQWNHQIYVCGFETDMMGMSMCMGEIIGVSHATTGWNGKWFRIVAMEELMDFEVKLELEEFNPYCYHDNGVPVLQGYSHSGFPTPYVPRNVERLEVKEDIEFNRLYFTFKKPARDAGYFIGARIYRKTGTDTWEFVATISETASSVKLAQNVGIDDTTIYYDNDSLYGSFPSQGIIWIENELMYYHGIDTTNYAFTNVVRGYKDTDQVVHSIDDNDLYITLKDDSVDYLEIDPSWAGTTQTFKVSATTIHFLTISLDISPSVTIDVIGYGVLPYFPESIQNKLPGTENVFESLGLSEYTIELSIEHVIETLGLSDSKVVIETLTFLIESLGLGDELRDVSVINIVESLGLGDYKYQPDYVNVIEAIGLGDSKLVVESLAQLAETLGLGDVFTEEIIINLVETLGLSDTKTVTETLTQLAETLGLGDEILFKGIEYIYETLGLGESTEDLSDGEDAVMMLLNNNLL